MLAHVAGLQIFSLSGESSGDFLRQLVVEMRSTRDLAAPWNLKLKRSVLSRLLPRSEEHTSELQSLMRISYAVFCLKKKKYQNTPKQYCRNYHTRTGTHSQQTRHT